MFLGGDSLLALGRRSVWLALLAASGCVQSASLGNELAGSAAGGGGDGDAGAYGTADGEWSDTEYTELPGSDTATEPEPGPDDNDDGGSTGEPVTLPSSWDPPEGCTGEASDGLRCLPAAVVDCDTGTESGVSWWRADDPDAALERLWVAGVYQTRSDHTIGHHPTGHGSVSWSIPGANVLVLSAYEPTDWTVTLAGGGQLSRVVATGHHAQSIDAPPGVVVETLAHVDGVSDYACGYAVPGNGGGCEGEELVAFAQQHTGLSVAGFDGCYDATEFVFGW